MMEHPEKFNKLLSSFMEVEQVNKLSDVKI
jgi:hypothetical protein